jgi:hypothetical protein
MSEIKTEIKRNADGSYIITDAHSTADIIRWLLTQDDKDTVLYLLGGVQPKREWVGLTEDEADECACKAEVMAHSRNNAYMWDIAYLREVEAKLKEKNT